MKLTLIFPNIGFHEHGDYTDEGRMEPLPLSVLAALTPPDVECVMYDDRMEDIPFDEPTDLVAISIEIYTARRSYEIAAQYRERGIPVVFGGMHVTLLPEEASKFADSIYIGDAETGWAGVIEDFKRGELKPVYHAPVGVPQEGGIIPKRELYADKGYLPLSLLQYTRGCRFACDFCAVSVYFERKNYVRATHEIIKEIEQQNRKFLFFVDDNFLSDQQRAKEFLRALIPLKVKWVSQASLDMTNDLELMDLLARSGCLGNVVGFESIVPESVKSMKKAPNFIGRKEIGWDRYEKQVQILRDHHLQTWATFTLGHDSDTLESIEETHQFAMENKFCFAAYNILMPYPSTPLYNRLRDEKRLLYGGKWWMHPDYRFNHASFIPKNMSPDELTEAVWRNRDRWNRPSSIFKRMWDFKTHMSSITRFLLYLSYNPLYAKETLRKQGMLFGLTKRKEKLRPESIDQTTWDPADGYIPVDDLFMSGAGMKSSGAGCGCTDTQINSVETVSISGLG